MRVAIVGAAGKVGRLTVAAASAAGHDTVAIARDPGRIPDLAGPNSFRRASADVLDRDAIIRPLEGTDAAIATFGAPLTIDTILHVPDLCERGTRNLLDAMRINSVRRLICMTAIGVGESKGHGRWIFRNVVQPALLQRIFTDRERQEVLVRESDTRWTIVRPAELTDGPEHPIRVVDLSEPSESEPSTVSRISVANFLVRELESEVYVGRCPVVTE